MGYIKRSYSSVKKEFEVAGRIWTGGFVTRKLTAANKLGIWLSGITLANDNYIDIGFIEWCEINYIYIDTINKVALFSIKDGDEFIKSTNWLFRALYKKAYTYIDDEGNFFVTIPTKVLSNELILYIIDNELTEIYLEGDDTVEDNSIGWGETLKTVLSAGKTILDLFG